MKNYCPSCKKGYKDTFQYCPQCAKPLVQTGFFALNKQKSDRFGNLSDFLVKF